MGTIKTISCLRATSCINRTVGPSGIFSTDSYHLASCSAQKYGVVKTSCIQRIRTPCLFASWMNPMTLSVLAFFILSMGSEVGQAFEAWINPHLTTLAIGAPPNAEITLGLPGIAPIRY